MSAPLPLSSGLPPPLWPDATLGAARQTQAPVTVGAEWFAPSPAARTLSVRPDAGSHRDVEGWVQALVDHLIEPADTPR